MKELLLILTLASLVTLAPEAQAGFTQSRATQIQLTVDGPSGSAEASRHQGFAVSGSGLSVSGPLNIGDSFNSSAQFTVGAEKEAFNFSLSTFERDLTAPVVLSTESDLVLPAYSTVSVTSGGNADGLSGSISQRGDGQITPGGQGTSATLTQSYTFSVFEHNRP
ncbi:hypothetical protein [Nodosilinea sp. E11]|uniref:hypothetical protein n=1 Tax=Nodosilinea sp. E11 TaxID=3037479 RepID=UPI002934F278|nr:hypothetical protein [Nodosilinea sp. E11]WOD37361.1 hypothetical protein RRF56_02485 [Nodosilinea sp. E11]